MDIYEVMEGFLDRKMAGGQDVTNMREILIEFIDYCIEQDKAEVEFEKLREEHRKATPINNFLDTINKKNRSLR